jgi:hypothetical protein
MLSTRATYPRGTFLYQETPSIFLVGPEPHLHKTYSLVPYALGSTAATTKISLFTIQLMQTIVHPPTRVSQMALLKSLHTMPDVRTPSLSLADAHKELRLLVIFWVVEVEFSLMVAFRIPMLGLTSIQLLAIKVSSLNILLDVRH